MAVPLSVHHLSIVFSIHGERPSMTGLAYHTIYITLPYPTELYASPTPVYCFTASFTAGAINCWTYKYYWNVVEFTTTDHWRLVDEVECPEHYLVKNLIVGNHYKCEFSFIFSNFIL